MNTVVIVGSSVSAVRTARALRKEGHSGRIIVVGKETHLPYDKPPLSKQFLAGDWDVDRITMLTAEDATAANIELRLGVPAQRLELREHMVILADGDKVPYDVVVVATGADARQPPWPTESGVHVIRTLDDSRALALALAAPGPVVVVGGGFIGAEAASTALSAGHRVTIVDPNPAPIGRLVGTEMGSLLSDIHRRHGVETRLGVGVTSVAGRAGALRVTLADGEVLHAATVIVGIGAVPNDSWLSSSGLLIDNGVVCDEFCRAVDQSDVYAVGDVARWLHPGHQEDVRVEHWTNAAEQAACVAHNITHPHELRRYAPTEYVWSDQYGWKIQIAGRPGHGVLHRIIGDLHAERPQAAAVFTDDSGLLRGIVTVNWPKALMTCRQMLGVRGTTTDAVNALTALPQLAVAQTAER